MLIYLVPSELILLSLTYKYLFQKQTNHESQELLLLYLKSSNNPIINVYTNLYQDLYVNIFNHSDVYVASNSLIQFISINIAYYENILSVIIPLIIKSFNDTLESETKYFFSFIQSIMSKSVTGVFICRTATNCTIF